MDRPGFRRLLRLRGFSAGDAVREVEDEVELHIELRTAELIRLGLDPGSARERALRLFARDEHTLRELYSMAIVRDKQMRMRERLESLTQDLRYAVRGFIRDPALTAFILMTLTLGIGANVTAWSLVDRLLLRDPAHVVEADRVIRLYGEVQWGEQGLRTSSWIPYSAYRQFRDVTSFAAVGAYRIVDEHVGEGAEARRLRVAQTLGAFFPLLGVQPATGRLFAEEEDAAIAGELAVVSHELWRSSYGGAATVVGQSVTVGGVPHTIIGVVPPGFTGTQPQRVDVWVLGSSASAGRTNWNVVGRLRPGVTAAAATAEATAIHEPDATGSFAWFRDVRIFTVPLSWGDTGREPIEATLARWLAGVTAIILLITFANVVNLLLVRIARRRRELAIRVSLGAGRARVVRLIAVEGVLIAVVSGVASMLVAGLTEPIVRRALMADEAGWTFTIADGRVLGLVGAIVLLTIICVGTVPALKAGNPQVADALRGGARAGSASYRIRGTLTVVQAALSVLLLVGAGLFLRSFANVRALDLGVDRDRVMTVDATLPPFRSFGPREFEDESQMERGVYRRLESAARRLPGVEQAAIAIGLPLDGGSFSAPVWLPGRDSIPTRPGGGPFASTVSAGYFTTIGTTIVYGRSFTDADREGSEPVVIINETMAHTIWSGRAALDQCMHIGDRANPCARIIGIAEDVHRTGLREQPSFQYYMPLGQQKMFGGARLVVRPTSATPVAPAALRQAIMDAEPRVRAVEISPLVKSLDGEMRPLRIGMVSFGISGALALVVATLGLYSLMAYMVAWRTHEIGVRVALGAGRGDVVELVLRRGIALAAAGVAAGLGLAAIGGQWLQPHLFETSARDATVMGLVAVALITTAALAGWVPARRATRISPTEALRAE